MQWTEGGIRWSPRVEKEKIAKAYYNDAADLADEDLLDDIGTALYLRCVDILYIADAEDHRWRCPRCEAGGTAAPLMALIGDTHRDTRDNAYSCPACALEMTWGQFRASYKRKQLNPGGAVESFARYTSRWAGCKDASEKFAAIDELIHAFHYSLRADPSLPTRTASVNLLEGNLTDLVPFLDDLTAGRNDPVTQRYLQEMQRMKVNWAMEKAPE